MVFDSEVRRISRGPLYVFFIARRVEFQERTSMALNVGRKEFQEGACKVFDCQASRISGGRLRLHGYLSLIHLCFRLFVI